MTYYHDNLLELAEHLARLEPGRPKESTLRRAVSTAYYAVFHALAFLCADELVGYNRPWEAFTPIYRTLDHSAARKLFERARSKNLYGEEVADIGGAFIDLQEQRHRADYDPQPLGLTRNGALELIDKARKTILAIPSLPVEKKRMLAIQLIANPRRGGGNP